MRRFRFLTSLPFALVTLSAGLAVMSVGTAQATPQFARQTDLPCATCHTHVPLLNAFGRRFYANGFRLGGSGPSGKALPLWGSIGALGSISEGLNGAVPVTYASTEVASYGSIDKARLLYHFEYYPVDKHTYINGLSPIGGSTTLQAGEIGLLGQYDPDLDVSPTRPVNLEPAGAGSLGGGRSGPFAPASDAYAVRIVQSLTSGSAMPFTNGWKLSATVPFSDEAFSRERPSGIQPTLGKSPTGLFAEVFRRAGFNSFGADSFVGRDGRRYYGVVGQLQLNRVFLEGGASFASFNGAQTRMASLTVTYVPSFDEAFSFRLDLQDGLINYVPCLSWLIGGKTSALRIVFETTITQGVAPSTTVEAQFKF